MQEKKERQLKKDGGRKRYRKKCILQNLKEKILKRRTEDNGGQNCLHTNLILVDGRTNWFLDTAAPFHLIPQYIIRES